jgi:hypothetical protein
MSHTIPPTARLTRRPLLSVALAVACSLFSTAALVLLATPTPVLAATPTQDTAFEAAFQAFQRASASGDETLNQQAFDGFSALLHSQPADPVLMAYTGAATSMKAKFTMLPWRKMSHAEEGLALLDKSLALLGPAHDAPGRRGTPAVLETRFVAASTFLSLPGMFNRHARGEKLLAEVLGSPLFDTSPLPFKAAVWLRAGQEAQAAQHPADARRLYQQTIASGAPQAVAAQAALKELAP